MKEYANEFTVVMMSKILGVSKSGYYKWLRYEPEKSLRSSQIDEHVTKAFNKNQMIYGSPRITKYLNENGVLCYSKTTIARCMQKLNLVARPKRKYVVTTDSDHDLAVPGNLLDRNFEVERINTCWVSDITYVLVGSKWMYLTIFIDLADRMVVGWSLSNNMTARDTVCAAFSIAVAKRGISKGSQLMVHSDRGVQYASVEFRNLISAYDCIQSMSRKGNCWDNAVAESFFKTIKIEALNRYKFKDSIFLRKVIFRYIDGFYNTVRYHSALGGLSPLKASIMKQKKNAA